MESINDAVELLTEEFIRNELEQDYSGLYATLNNILTKEALLSFENGLQNFYNTINDENNKPLNDAFIGLCMRCSLQLNWNLESVKKELLENISQCFNREEMFYADFKEFLQKSRFSDILLFIFRLHSITINQDMITATTHIGQGNKNGK